MWIKGKDKEGKRETKRKIEKEETKKKMVWKGGRVEKKRKNRKRGRNKNEKEVKIKSRRGLKRKRGPIEIHNLNHLW